MDNQPPEEKLRLYIEEQKRAAKWERRIAIGLLLVSLLVFAILVRHYYIMGEASLQEATKSGVTTLHEGVASGAVAPCY